MPCCHLHQDPPNVCCDPNDCGACCENCPTCPVLGGPCATSFDWVDLDTLGTLLRRFIHDPDTYVDTSLVDHVVLDGTTRIKPEELRVLRLVVDEVNRGVGCQVLIRPGASIDEAHAFAKRKGAPSFRFNGKTHEGQGVECVACRTLGS